MTNQISNLLSPTGKQTTLSCRPYTDLFYRQSKYVVFAISLAFISACQNDNNNTPEKPIADETHSEVGLWIAPAYGQVLDIAPFEDNGHVYTMYNITDSTCILVDDGELSSDELSTYITGNDFSVELELIEPDQTIVPGTKFERI